MTGQGEFECEKVRVKFSPSDLVFAGRGDTHCFENHTLDTASRVIRSVSPPVGLCAFNFLGSYVMSLRLGKAGAANTWIGRELYLRC